MAVALLLLFFGFSSCAQFPLREYYYVNKKMTWSSAQQYCREHYTDLATFESMDDINRLKPPFTAQWVWIGLKDDPKSWREEMGSDLNSWRWSATGKTSQTGYHNFSPGEPQSENGNANCVFMDSNGGWRDENCETSFSFVCYRVSDQNEKTFVLISDQKSWTSAQTYCREYHTDLPTIESLADNNEVYSVMGGSGAVWIGLYRTPWTWSDKSLSSFRNWKSGEPNNHGGNQFCASENTDHWWYDNKCHLEFPFICQRVSRFRTIIRMKIKSEADMTDPAVKAKLLQQLREELSQNGTDVKLEWKTEPKKEEL